MHIQETELIELYAADFAAEVCALGAYCPTLEEAKGILTAEALARVDSDFAQGASIASSFGPQMPYEFAGAFLDKLAKANDSGTGQPYFSATAQDYGNHQLNAQYLVDNKELYDLATAYGGTALRGYGDAFVLALAGQNDVRGGASAQDLAALRADLAALPEAELQALATQIAVEMATAGVAIPAADLLLDSTGVTTEDFSNEMLQVGLASLELGQEMLVEIEAKYRAGEPLSDDERWLVMMASAGGFAATGGAAMLSWVKTVKLPRFRRLVDAGGGDFKAVDQVEYNPTGAMVAQGDAPVCGPASCTMVIRDATGNSIDLQTVIGQFDEIRRGGVNIRDMSKVLVRNGVAHSPVASLSPAQLRHQLENGNSVIVRVPMGTDATGKPAGHFVVIDSIQVIDGTSYYMTRDPFVGARGVRAGILDNTFNQTHGVTNAIIIGN